MRIRNPRRIRHRTDSRTGTLNHVPTQTPWPGDSVCRVVFYLRWTWIACESVPPWCYRVHCLISLESAAACAGHAEFCRTVDHARPACSKPEVLCVCFHGDWAHSLPG